MLGFGGLRVKKHWSSMHVLLALGTFHTVWFAAMSGSREVLKCIKLSRSKCGLPTVLRMDIIRYYWVFFPLLGHHSMSCCEWRTRCTSFAWNWSLYSWGTDTCRVHFVCISSSMPLLSTVFGIVWKSRKTEAPPKQVCHVF